MKRFVALIKSVKKIEWLAAATAISVLLLLLLKGGGTAENRFEGTELEMRLAATLSSVEGAGRVQVLVNEKQAVPAFSGGGEAEITGVVIVAEGARDLRTALSLQQAAKTLLKIELDQIQVLAMNEGG